MYTCGVSAERLVGGCSSSSFAGEKKRLTWFVRIGVMSIRKGDAGGGEPRPGMASSDMVDNVNGGRDEKEVTDDENEDEDEDEDLITRLGK